MAEANKNTKSTKRVFDIAKPSTTPEPANSKSIIVGHGLIMHDPTIVSEDQKDTEPVDEIKPEVAHQIKIEPPPDEVIEDNKTPEENHQETSSSVEPNTDTKQLTLEPSKALKTEIAALKPEEAEVEKNKDHPPDQDNKADKINSSAEVPKTNQEETEEQQQQKNNQAELDASIAKQTKISELVAKQTYFLPINSKEKQYNKKVVLIGVLVCLILVIAWVDIALDAGLIANSFHLPHTHFFTLRS